MTEVSIVYSLFDEVRKGTRYELTDLDNKLYLARGSGGKVIELI